MTTAEDTSVSVTAGTLSVDDLIEMDTLTVTGISQPLHGSAVLTGTTVTYTPDDDFNGVDSLTYTVSDGHGGTATGTLAVTVTPVNVSRSGRGHGVRRQEHADNNRCACQ